MGGEGVERVQLGFTVMLAVEAEQSRHNDGRSLKLEFYGAEILEILPPG